MAYLLFPGRHILNTQFQEHYLRSVLRMPIQSLRFADDSPPVLADELNQIVFAITSANQQNSRYNPLPLPIRAIGVDRFADSLRDALGTPYRVFGIPHYAPNTDFAEHTIKEIAAQSEGQLQLQPSNCVVLCSTPAVVQQYRALGFAVLLAELDKEHWPNGQAPMLPGQLLQHLAALPNWAQDPVVRQHLSIATFTLWQDYPESLLRLQRLWRDPLLTDSGGLTETRNYATYAYDMGNQAILELKYQDIKGAIREGKIVDEGCADGALLVPIARDFPDSDLIGIDITGEFIARCNERQRAGNFGGAYVHFHQRNLMDAIFAPTSITTTICNSTAHELWSYAQRQATLSHYLQEKFKQTARGGRIIIRDVVGPQDKDRLVLLHCDSTDGSNEVHYAEIEDQATLKKFLDGLSTRARFMRFAHDFLRETPHYELARIRYAKVVAGGERYFRLTLKDAMEFLLHKDYTDNWRSEMHEEFCFYSYTEWQRQLEQAGFNIVVHPTTPEQGSRAYANSWIIETRLQNKTTLYVQQGRQLQQLEWPHTNMVLVGQRP